MEYEHDGALRLGIFHHILKHVRNNSKSNVVVIRRLRRVDTHSDKSLAVTEFGHKRMAYRVRPIFPNDVRLDCVSTQVRHTVPVVRDMYDISLIFYISQSTLELSATSRERIFACFFSFIRSTVHRYPLRLLLTLEYPFGLIKKVMVRIGSS